MLFNFMKFCPKVGFLTEVTHIHLESFGKSKLAKGNLKIVVMPPIDVQVRNGYGCNLSLKGTRIRCDI